MSDDLLGGQDAVVPSGMGVGGERHLEAAVHRAPRCRVHAEVGLDAAGHETFNPCLAQDLLQVRPGEGVANSLDDDRLARLRRDRRPDREARLTRLQRRVDLIVVLDVNHPRAG